MLLCQLSLVSTTGGVSLDAAQVEILRQAIGLQKWSEAAEQGPWFLVGQVGADPAALLAALLLLHGCDRDDSQLEQDLEASLGEKVRRTSCLCPLAAPAPTADHRAPMRSSGRAGPHRSGARTPSRWSAARRCCWRRLLLALVLQPDCRLRKR